MTRLAITLVISAMASTAFTLLGCEAVKEGLLTSKPNRLLADGGHHPHVS